MPELPEVEVTRQGLERVILGEEFSKVIVRERRFRQSVPTRRLRSRLVGRRVLALRRRSKYLLIDVEGAKTAKTTRVARTTETASTEPVGGSAATTSTVIIHLGMSGGLRVLDRAEPRASHEHVVFQFASGKDLRFRDPRRFGLVLIEPTVRLEENRLFSHLGPEPLLDDFHDDHLFLRSRGRKVSVKTFLMDARNVVGVGNIYASEALFRAGIHPGRPAGRVGRERMVLLVSCVRDVLSEAIAQGGTTLKDFSNADGDPGYFEVRLAVYGRAGEPCLGGSCNNRSFKSGCGGTVRRIVQSNRATFYCPQCQR